MKRAIFTVLQFVLFLVAFAIGGFLPILSVFLPQLSARALGHDEVGGWTRGFQWDGVLLMLGSSSSFSSSRPCASAFVCRPVDGAGPGAGRNRRDCHEVRLHVLRQIGRDREFVGLSQPMTGKRLPLCTIRPACVC